MKIARLVVIVMGMAPALALAEEEVAAPAAAFVPKPAVQASLAEGIDLSRLSTEPGVHIVPLAKSPFGKELADQIRKEVAQQATAGSYSPVRDPVPDLRATMRSRKKRSALFGGFPDPRYSTLEEARPHLRYEPLSIAGTALDGASLVDVSTGGERSPEGRWSGVTRSWEVAGLGLVQLDESEFLETGGSITVIQEWINAEVLGRPATLKTMRSAAGKSLVSVAWMTDSTSYRLDLQPLDPTALKANEQALLALANGVGR